jgi:hypothetical protein
MDKVVEQYKIVSSDNIYTGKRHCIFYEFAIDKGLFFIAGFGFVDRLN